MNLKVKIITWVCQAPLKTESYYNGSRNTWSVTNFILSSALHIGTKVLVHGTPGQLLNVVTLRHQEVDPIPRCLAIDFLPRGQPRFLDGFNTDNNMKKKTVELNEEKKPPLSCTQYLNKKTILNRDFETCADENNAYLEKKSNIYRKSNRMVKCNDFLRGNKWFDQYINRRTGAIRMSSASQLTRSLSTCVITVQLDYLSVRIYWHKWNISQLINWLFGLSDSSNMAP